MLDLNKSLKFLIDNAVIIVLEMDYSLYDGVLDTLKNSQKFTFLHDIREFLVLFALNRSSLNC